MDKVPPMEYEKEGQILTMEGFVDMEDTKFAEAFAAKEAEHLPWVRDKDTFNAGHYLSAEEVLKKFELTESEMRDRIAVLRVQLEYVRNRSFMFLLSAIVGWGLAVGFAIEELFFQ